MVLFDEAGEELTTRLELGMRVERLLGTSNRLYIVLGSEDSYIDVIDLKGPPLIPRPRRRRPRSPAVAGG